MNTRPVVAPDGWVIYKIVHTMGGRVAPLGVTRYGDRYYFRDLGPSEEESRCSFNIRADDLRKALDQADDEQGTFGDVCHLSIGCQNGVSGWALDDDDDEDEDDVVPMGDESEELRNARHWIQARLEGFL